MRMTRMSSVRTVTKIAQYELRDVLRSRWLLAYALFFLAATEIILQVVGNDAHALVNLVSLVLGIVPLANVLFGTVYLYQSRDFIELLLAQPMRRGELFTGLYVGLALPLSAALALALLIPFAVHGIGPDVQRGTIAAVLVAGILLTGIFLAVALAIAVRIEDRIKGFAVAVLTWLAVSVVYDGLVLVASSVFADYPLERPLLVAMLGNPVDLARVFMLLELDATALMGYTGAVFQRFFGTVLGVTTAVVALVVWVALPYWVGRQAFARRDF